ncbi:hypothetical protein [Paracoccus siganidrum]|uniref:Uncharacterized protein n=1 Tax=Paracoccus siganidrum TaxID=1276757 RepID=A0A419ACN5_9RHOB|nr:hypothetical protein [Paracoccus siganidrum]RJL22195.1 hypothetical protein D3P05_00775 [Paracoccus siganidrum]RMC26071.1 hypothetical protein C9E82_22820 [Paracoccus siganidrum]
MSTATSLEDISLELSKLSCLLSALELTTDGMTAADDEYSRQRRDATVGLVEAMRVQMEKTHQEVQNQIKQELARKRAA